jgi:hypothetical protein
MQGCRTRTLKAQSQILPPRVIGIEVRKLRHGFILKDEISYDETEAAHCWTDVASTRSEIQ